MAETTPSVLGLKRSFGFGDRLGCATPGHMDAVRGTPFLPVFAQQSIRELARTRRTPEEVMRAAAGAVQAEDWPTPWGADADHLQTHDDVNRMAAAGYTFFTVDPSAHVDDGADRLAPDELRSAYEEKCAAGIPAVDEVLDLYLGKSFDVGRGRPLAFSGEEQVLRSAVKYGAAVVHTERMAGWIAAACAGRPFELEMSVDETETPTSPREHLFVGLELKRRGVALVSLAPRFTGSFEKGIDFKGDLAEFERHYETHVAVARFCGPYKLSIHSGSDKFGVYPAIGRLSGDLLHVKTAGTSFLEALRVVCRTDTALFRDIAAFCRGRYDTDRASYHVSAGLEHVPERIEDGDLERWYLENESGRQILHVTFGSVLAGGTAPDGGAFKKKILENLAANGSIYREVLHEHLGRHLRLLMKESP